MRPKVQIIALAVLLAACNGRAGTPQSGSAETGRGNGAGFKPAFENQTRAPLTKANVAFKVVEVAKDLDEPFGMAFLADGRVLVTERPGRLRIVQRNGALSPAVAGTPRVTFAGQGGMLDVALDPAFATNGLVYLSYSEPQADGTSNTAVARGRLVEGPAPKLEGVQVIYRQAPSIDSRGHFGSRLVFARDGTLFVAQGDRQSTEGRVQAQKMDSLIGKLVRINADGSIPADNPFVGRPGFRPEIWSFGHRNIQGLAMHPATGEMWALEHGPQGGDEINIPKKGLDYGWPTITYGVDYGPGARKVAGSEGIPAKAGMEQPVYYWDPVIAPGGLAFYSGDLFPAWKGSLFAAGLNSGYIARLTLDGNQVVGEERFNLGSNTRHRDIEQGPDGALYVLLDDDGKLVKLVP